MGLFAGVHLASTLARGAEDLEHDFAQPPDGAKPWVNWFWLDGNITREGITADLEAMERVGIGGALLMDVTQDIPAGPVRFGSQQWREMFRHTVAEAQRLGLKISMNNAPGWSGSGGPWITPDLAMQKLVWSKTNLFGPAHFEDALPPAPMMLGSYHDVAVLAFPTLVGDGASVPGFGPRITGNLAEGFVGGKLLDGDPSTFVMLPLASPQKPQCVQVEFAEPFTASHIKLTGVESSQAFAGVLQVSNDGRSFRNIREFQNRRADLLLDFEQLSARYFRILFTRASSLSSHLEFSDLELVPSFRIELAQAKAGLGRWTTIPASPPSVPSYSIIKPDSIIDLTSSVTPGGRLSFEVPKGQWTVLRFGFTPTGKENHPVPAEGRGLECDKLSREAIEAHFQAFLGKLIADTGGTAAGAFSATHIDSWENGYQNWTPHFAEEFRKRRGYDLTRFLPTFSGRIVGDLEVSERFLWDVRRTIADLWADNYAGRLAELSHEHGLQLSIEAYANGPFDNLLYAGRADVPMAEFWAEPDDNSRFHTSRSMASAAHTYGKEVIAAEAFTAYPKDAKWQNHPFSLKPLADAAFCEGINRIVFHRYAHQPWLDRKPGMTMGQWGVHYERTETWWEQSKPWHDYLARCQFLLQRGLFVADICYLTEEGGFNDPPTPDKLEPPPPAGYTYDLVCPEVVLKRMTVKDGSVSLPDGMSYSLLLLPGTNTMSPQLLRKIKELVEAGATVVGPPPTKSPSLSDYPLCDAEVKKVANEVWGDCDGKNRREHRLGKGRILWGEPLNQILAQQGLAPDFEQLSSISGNPLRSVHRRIERSDFYFVANSNLQPVIAECVFRVAGRQPEIWQPDTGKISKPASWREKAGRTTMILNLDPAGSLFVVFRDQATNFDPVTLLTRDGKPDLSSKITPGASGKLELLADQPGRYQMKTASGRLIEREVRDLPRAREITGPWDLHFPGKSGAPERVTLERLISWTEHRDPGVKYFSGIATYRKILPVSAELLTNDLRLYLDLGKVCIIAEVKVNEREMGILWKPPFRLDVSDVLKSGENALEIRVVNLWPNRLIGDEQLADDCQWGPAQADYGSPLKGWPKWLLEGKPSPTGRLTFTTWKHWTRDSQPLESGLLGPVMLQVKKRIIVEAPRSRAEGPKDTL